MRRCAVVGDRPDKIDEATPEPNILNAAEGFVELDALRRGQEGTDSRGGVVGVADRRRRAARSTFEEVRHRDAQKARRFLQSASADAVLAAFVFLDLLEGDAEVPTELRLAEAHHHAKGAYAAADIDVDRIGMTVSHSSSPRASKNAHRPFAPVMDATPRPKQARWQPSAPARAARTR